MLWHNSFKAEKGAWYLPHEVFVGLCRDVGILHDLQGSEQHASAGQNFRRHLDKD